MLTWVFVMVSRAGLARQLGPLLDRVGDHGQVHGIELSDTMLAMARSRFAEEVRQGRLSLQSGNLTALPLPSASLDAAITVNTLYFVADVQSVFGELARVLRPGGRLVVGVGDPVAMAALPFVAHGFALRPIDELTGLLRAAGFQEPHDERLGEGDDAYHLLVADLPGR